MWETNRRFDKSSMAQEIQDLMARIEVKWPSRLPNLVQHRNATLSSVLSFLRGPDETIGDDYSSNRLKWLTVSRARAIVCPSYMGYVCVTPITPNERFERDQLLAKSSTHFQCHWRYAVEAIKALYNYDLENEQEVRGV